MARSDRSSTSSSDRWECGGCGCSAAVVVSFARTGVSVLCCAMWTWLPQRPRPPASAALSLSPSHRRPDAKARPSIRVCPCRLPCQLPLQITKQERRAIASRCCGTTVAVFLSPGAGRAPGPSVARLLIHGGCTSHVVRLGRGVSVWVCVRARRATHTCCVTATRASGRLCSSTLEQNRWARDADLREDADGQDDHAGGGGQRRSSTEGVSSSDSISISRTSIRAGCSPSCCATAVLNSAVSASLSPPDWHGT
jgi:hypothetical protein